VLQRLNVPDLAQPPGYAHVVVASGTRVVMTAGQCPLDAEGNLVGAGDVPLRLAKLWIT
jgi:enamine deaminase RidA (YjgF/YER057c/UK114 family)